VDGGVADDLSEPFSADDFSGDVVDAVEDFSDSMAFLRASDG